MKKLLFIALLLTVVIAGCKKDTQVKVPPSIIGSWEVRASYGGIVGIANYPAGNGNILRFNSDGTYSTYLQFNLNSQGTFQIVKNGIVSGQSSFDALYYNQDKTGIAIHLVADTLVLGLEGQYYLSSKYVRQ